MLFNIFYHNLPRFAPEYMDFACCIKKKIVLKYYIINIIKLVKRQMKKLLSVLLALTMLLSVAVVSYASAPGDIDGDGSVTATDARYALRASVGLESLSDAQKILADYDKNGSVEAADARMVLRVSVGLPADDTKPEEKPSKPEETPEEKPAKPEYKPSEKELIFYQNLYATAHPLLGSYPAIYDNSNPLSFLLKNFQKWCCLHTISNVFRPALEKSGYSKEQVDLLAPRTYSRDSLAKLLSNVLGIKWSDKFVVDSLPLYVPSLLSDYYIKTPDAADVYFLYDFYDDMIEQKVYEHSDEDRENYQPRIGDVLFISNKTRTYENGYPTVDHTAQIIEILPDGTFICTEGSLIDENDPTGLARVQERRYMYDEKTGSYCYRDDAYIYRHIVVLYAAQPKF